MNMLKLILIVIVFVKEFSAADIVNISGPESPMKVNNFFRMQYGPRKVSGGYTLFVDQNGTGTIDRKTRDIKSDENVLYATDALFQYVCNASAVNVYIKNRQSGLYLGVDNTSMESVIYATELGKNKYQKWDILYCSGFKKIKLNVVPAYTWHQNQTCEDFHDDVVTLGTFNSNKIVDFNIGSPEEVDCMANSNIKICTSCLHLGLDFKLNPTFCNDTTTEQLFYISQT